MAREEDEAQSIGHRDRATHARVYLHACHWVAKGLQTICIEVHSVEKMGPLALQEEDWLRILPAAYARARDDRLYLYRSLHQRTYVIGEISPRFLRSGEEGVAKMDGVLLWIVTVIKEDPYDGAL